MNINWLFDIFRWLWRDDQREDWHRKVSLLPRVTRDGYFIWLVPAWRKCWIGGGWDPNWGYEWRWTKPEDAE